MARAAIPFSATVVRDWTPLQCLSMQVKEELERQKAGITPTSVAAICSAMSRMAWVSLQPLSDSGHRSFVSWLLLSSCALLHTTHPAPLPRTSD